MMKCNVLNNANINQLTMKTNNNVFHHVIKTLQNM